MDKMVTRNSTILEIISEELNIHDDTPRHAIASIFGVDDLDDTTLRMIQIGGILQSNDSPLLKYLRGISAKLEKIGWVVLPQFHQKYNKEQDNLHILSQEHTFVKCLNPHDILTGSIPKQSLLFKVFN